MHTYNAIRTCVARLHKKISFRRKSAKARPTISQPFDFKKEDTLCFLRGISSEELTVMREKAAASIVGSATNSPFPDSPPLPSSQAHGESDHRIVRTHTANSASTTATGMARRSPQPCRSHSQQYDYHNHYNHRAGGPMTFHSVVLASAEAYAPAGLASASCSSSASSINSLGRDRD
ncbi:hypothetical protein CMQ_5590 [Grosmannia clavigera kw1407]|uniref:Uncharacterized protein n=1 Tax=Grosmannia clavigera (strain kw1407 / UAMH 11150) TaxID=655863 RepID=F0XSY3_GROCL|nr:uncharacterized protein CMQ_5590 [Grosmannia clavigera kw1407]EFW99169.1 hypothetical protein CMQ_5590 [Grosmannia clavigera kw1407]